MSFERLESFGQLRNVDSESRTVTSVISTGDIARDGAIIEPKGWEFEHYDRNPVVLWMHDADAMPFARTVEHIASDKELIAKAEFDLEDPRGASVFRKIQNGYINATSVRWLPKETEVRKVGEGKEARDVLVFLRQELLEWSFVTVPADPAALIVRADGEALSLVDYLPPGYCTQTPYDAEPIAYLDFVPTEDLERPYPNEHACRVRPPSAFQKDSFRRIRKTSDGKPFFIIIGRLKGETTTSTQAYRYPKDSWSTAQASAHCKRNDGKTFEPAAKAENMEMKRLEGRVVSHLAQRLARPSTKDLIIAGLAKATGKTEETIRQNMARGGYR